MKKATLLLLICMGLIIGTHMPCVNAYSPHYLPGGKNYLSEDNFTYEDDHLITDAPFLVKPYTDYCLTVTREYVESDAVDIVINSYNNSDLLGSLTIDIVYGFTIMPGTNYQYVTFKTSADTNYIDLTFDDGRDYFLLASIAEFMLEEGTTSSAALGIEAYVEGDIIDANGPVFSGAGVVLSDVDNPIEIEDVLAGIYAYDSIDEDVTEAIVVVSDAYTGNGTTLGNYDIVFRVEDTSGNTTEFTCTIKVIDITKPVFSGPSEITVSHPNAYTIADLKGMINASDNYDGDISANITITVDNYSTSTGIVGDYLVTFEARDSSGNITAFSMTVSVIDADYPLFYGAGVVTIGYDQTLTVNEIQASIQAIDGYDGDVTAQINVKTDGYSLYQHKVGDYVIVFEVTDTAGNSNQKTVIVKVVDEIGPIIYFDTSIIKIYNTTILSMTDFTNLLKRSGELAADENYQLFVRYDSYSDHASLPGVYHLTLEFENDDGEILTKSLQIVVKNVSTQFVEANLDPVQENTISFFEQYQSWIIGGTLLVITIITNLVWFIQRKKL